MLVSALAHINATKRTGFLSQIQEETKKERKKINA